MHSVPSFLLALALLGFFSSGNGGYVEAEDAPSPSGGGEASKGAEPAAADPILRVPAFTGYLEPDPEGARVSVRRGITGWNRTDLKVLWFGRFENPGRVHASLVLRLPVGSTTRLRLSVVGRSLDAEAHGADQDPVTLNFGDFEIPEAGYHRFALESRNADGIPAGELEALVLEGPAIRGAHFNLEERRNASSVHLSYSVPRETRVALFHSEVTALDDPTHTFVMACGWHRGYFGMQVNGPTERRIIFSVWDSGNEAVDRSKVDDSNRVRLLEKGEGVIASDFGNEGTGGHSHLVYAWKTGVPQRFCVTARPEDGGFTVYTGYYFHPDRGAWFLVASWRAPKDGSWLRGLHGFSENFWGSNGHLRRKSLFSDQWIRTAEGRWIELTEARFSHDPTGKEARLDRFMGVEDGRFFLSHGGFGPGFTKSGERFTRPATGKPPADLPVEGGSMGVLVPRLEGEWWKIAGKPDLGPLTSPKEEPVDFAVWRAGDGTWQLWSCIRATREEGHTRLFHAWESAELERPDWKPRGIAMRADPARGEQLGGLQAPHVVRDGERWLMAYGDWLRICLAESRDGKAFERIVDPSGSPAIFGDGPKANARDPMFLRTGALWHIYYTGAPDGRGAVFARTSPDLASWSERRLVHSGGKGGDGPWSAECPHVVSRGGLFYLFRTQRYGAENITHVYYSGDPLDFGKEGDGEVWVASLPIAAPEIVVDGSAEYLAALEPTLDGIRMIRLRWEPAKEAAEEAVKEPRTEAAKDR